MKSLQDSYTLHNGTRIPCIGFGTWQIPDGDEAVACIKEAIRCGYRHIDTAAAYENETSVGRAVAECGVDRSELFITSKLWNSDHGYDNTLRAFEKTMSNLKLETLDLFLIHWPVPVNHKSEYIQLNRDTWKAFERLCREGRIKSIGVSNFLVHHLQEIMEESEIKPMVNQIELHPQCPQEELVMFCKNNNILVEAWSPLIQGEIFKIPLMRELAEKYGKSVSQIAIRWFVQKGIVPLPKSMNREHILQNAEVFDFEISDEDVAHIDSIKGVGKVGVDPDNINF